MTSSKKLEGYKTRIQSIRDTADCFDYIIWIDTLKRLTKHEKSYLVRCVKQRQKEIESEVEVIKC